MEYKERRDDGLDAKHSKRWGPNKMEWLPPSSDGIAELAAITPSYHR